jgi:hypothetical protein
MGGKKCKCRWLPGMLLACREGMERAGVTFHSKNHASISKLRVRVLNYNFCMSFTSNFGRKRHGVDDFEEKSAPGLDSKTTQTLKLAARFAY